MNEVVLAALLTAGGGVLVAVVNVFGVRLAHQLDTPELSDSEALLRAGIRRHILQCSRPGDLRDLLDL